MFSSLHFRLGLLLVSGVFLCFGGKSYGQGSKYSVVDKDLILAAPEVARKDSAGGNRCGEGVLSVLTSLGLADGLEGADGHDWEENLWEGGWRPLPCSTPHVAPYGSVLVYDSDYRVLGKNKRGTPGGRWGHVEFVSWAEGGRVYVSDTAREVPGGTVPDNFMGRAWVPPGFVRLFRDLQHRDLPFAGYVYRGPKGEGPGTTFPLEGEEFSSPEQYVLLGGRKGYFGPSPEVGRGDGAPAVNSGEDLPLGPSAVGPNPLFGAPIPYDGPSGKAPRSRSLFPADSGSSMRSLGSRGAQPYLVEDSYSDYVSSQPARSGASDGGLGGSGISRVSGGLAEEASDGERMKLLLAFRMREAQGLLAK